MDEVSSNSYDFTPQPSIPWRPKLIELDGEDPTQFKMRIHVQHLMPDRTQYKPYSIAYDADLWVEVTVTLEDVADYNDAYVVLTPKGMAHVADQLAAALDDLHDEFRNRSRNF